LELEQPGFASGDEAMKERDPMKGAARVLDLIEAYAELGEPMSLTELSQRIDIPISSCHSLVSTLLRRGYVYRLDNPKRVYPTKRLANLATAISRADQPLRRIVSVVEELIAATGETVIIGRLQNETALYLDVIEGTHTVRYAAAPGDQRPAHTSAIGKAVLSMLPLRDFRAALARLDMARVTDATITDRAAFEADINEGRKRGYYLSRGETVSDVMGIAIAVRFSGEAYAIGIAGPLARMEERRETYAARLAELKGAIEAMEG
jgi:IclR family transcriptional regulator, acetate operon repressor